MTMRHRSNRCSRIWKGHSSRITGTTIDTQQQPRIGRTIIRIFVLFLSSVVVSLHGVIVIFVSAFRIAEQHQHQPYRTSQLELCIDTHRHCTNSKSQKFLRSLPKINSNSFRRKTTNIPTTFSLSMVAKHAWLATFVDDNDEEGGEYKLHEENNNSNSSSKNCRKITIRQLSDTTDGQVRKSGQDDTEYNILSPREWLEHSENGAYSAIRCEYHSCDSVHVNDDNNIIILDPKPNSDTNNNHGEDVIHCATKKETIGRGTWKIWGIDYHLQRLANSYNITYLSNMNDYNNQSNNSNCDTQNFEMAYNDGGSDNSNHSSSDSLNPFLLNNANQRTMSIIPQMLSHTAAVIANDKSDNVDDSDRGKNSTSTLIEIFMLTILWHPKNDMLQQRQQRSSNKQRIIEVKAHLYPFSTTVLHSYIDYESNNYDKNELPVPRFSDVVLNPITMAIAIPSWDYPNRKQSLLYPQAKLSSWCTIRRPIEDTFRTKKRISLLDAKNNDGSNNNGGSSTYIDEIILTDCFTDSGQHFHDSSENNNNRNSDNVMLLEGLTSNIFCVYHPDNVIRTVISNSNDGKVLNGYAQHIVLRVAERMGYQLDTITPILLTDAPLWNEVFVTSSIKFMAPVDTIYQPIYNNSNSQPNVAYSSGSDIGDNTLYRQQEHSLNAFEVIWSYNNNANTNTSHDDLPFNSTTLDDDDNHHHHSPICHSIYNFLLNHPDEFCTNL